MFGFLRRWRANRSREIFSFWNGSKWAWADPLVLQRAIDEAGGENWMTHLDVLRTSSKMDPAKLSPTIIKEQERATAESLAALVGIVRKAFAVEPLSPETGNGVTEAECITLLAKFIAWMSEAEVDARPFRNSPPSTDSPPEQSTTEPS